MPVWLVPLLGFLQPLIAKFLPDKTAQLELQLELQKMALEQSGAQLDSDLKVALAQVGVNSDEAKSGNLFNSGWRPFIGWTCGIAFGYDFVMRPLMDWGCALAAVKVTAPNLDLTEMMPVLLGMLGLGAMRTYERVNGTVPPGK